MRRSLFLFAFCIFIAPYFVSAQDLDSLYHTATEAYGKDQYEEAIANFRTILEVSEEPTSEMYYNLACALYKSGDLPNAILNFERAYRLNPSDSDTKFNIELLNKKIEDKIIPSPTFVASTYVDIVTHLFSLSTWVILTVLFFVLFLALVILYLLGSSHELKLTGFYTSGVALLLFLFTLIFAVKSDHFIHDTSEAIITAPVVTLTSSPDGSANEIATLHSGLKVKGSRRVSNFIEVTLPDGMVGWLPKESLSFISPSHNNIDNTK